MHRKRFLGSLMAGSALAFSSSCASADPAPSLSAGFVETKGLAPCPSTPNCVSSLADPADTEHHIAPLRIGESGSFEEFRDFVTGLDRVTLVKEADGYLAFEFRTRLLRFVDDVEFLLAGDGETLQVRSASRVGVSDLGTNRQRVEDIRSLWEGL